MTNKLKEMMEWIKQKRKGKDNEAYEEQSNKRAKAILALITKRKLEKEKK